MAKPDHWPHATQPPRSNRDKVHGRVYRVTYKDRPLVKVLDLTTLSNIELLDQLKRPGGRDRYRARLELSGRDSGEVVAAVKAWTEGLDQADSDYIHHMLEGLWITQQHNQVNVDLLRQLLTCSEPKARAAATHVLCYCRDQVPDTMTLLQQQVNDSFPRVRLEAIRALSFLPSVASAEIALQALNHPRDKFINYCLSETMRSIGSVWKDHVASGEPFAGNNPAGTRYIMSLLSSTEVAGMLRNKTVYEELLSREGILHEVRYEAANGLASFNNSDANIELLAAIERLDKSDASGAQGVLADLTHVFLHGDGKGVHADGSQTDFSKYQPQLDALATGARREVTRQVAFATLMAAEKSADRMWNQSLESPARFRDFVSSLALVDDADVKSQLVPKVTELLQRLPMEIERQIEKDKVTTGRYIRIELPGEKRTLTLAEVEVMSGGRNIGPGGTATQSTTAHGSPADRGIDGNTAPIFSEGGQTHTRENQANPWWELDLGASQPLDDLIIWNRNEDDDTLGKRLDGFTVKVLDENRNVVFESVNNEAPETKANVVLQGDPLGAIRQATFAAAVHIVPGEASTFEALANAILNNQSRTAAVRAMNRLPKRSWVDRRIQPLVGDIISQVSALSAAERTRPRVIDEITLGKKLASALPVDQAKQMRGQLNDLGINVVVLRPVPHRMQYDRSHFFVEAGKPFQLILDNTDIMPHNVVITRPGSYAKVGIAAEMLATDARAAAGGYVPNMPEVMHASKMLQPSQIDRLDIVAPAEPGEYPYVCTYPGHWRRMYGVMHVVENLDEAPVESLVPTVDSEIAMRPFVREWTTDDLTTELEAASSGRSFERGRALFTELSCAQCHKIGHGDDLTGGDVGPNLLDLQKKFEEGDLNRAGLLKSLVEPSETIEEKYRSWIIQDIDGRVHTGVVAERTDAEIRLLANPLDNGKPITIAIDDIDEEIESKISMMPQGLLNTCTREEIYDLLMYVEAAAREDHPSFLQKK